MVSEAISHAQVDPKDIDNIVVVLLIMVSKQDFHGALPAINCEVLKHVPSLRVENACATGSAAIHTALNSIEAKRSKLNLVVGVEKMTDRSTKEAGDILLGASYRKEEDKIDGGFAGVFAQITILIFKDMEIKLNICQRLQQKIIKMVLKSIRTYASRFRF